MKKFFELMLLCATVIGIVSCEKCSENIKPEIVDVCFDVQFVQSGSMTRSASDEYSTFYNNHIKNKELVPQHYTLTITNSKNEYVATLNGTWNITSLQLPTGIYKVTGESNGDYKIASLKFDEEINITSFGTFTLTAQYDCFLLMFPTDKGASNYQYAEGNSLYSIKYEMPTIDNLSYMFVSDITPLLRISYDTAEGSNILDINNESFNFENGYYYYYNIISSSFDIPPMESGN